MKKRIIALILLFVMLLPVSLASCNKETEAEETALKVYTLYTICEESTTEEAIREVELALNRVIVYQLGIGVKLTMVTEDEYEKLIEDKYKEIEDYQAEQKLHKEEEKNNKDNSSDKSDDESSVNPEDIMTGDKFIDMLEAGEEYTLEAPRLDIFLVRGFDKYIDLVGEDKLAELDEKLSSEAKLIKDKIYPTFLSAAKVTNSKGKQKTYGVPMNTAIGEYEYVVFDEELLNKYEIDAMTMNTLEDLEYYLRIIKENEPDVIPLANAFDSTYCTYLFGDGFPSMVNSDGVVVNPYEDDGALDYYTYISRYRTLGYLGDESDANKRFAVKFVRGTFEDLEALEKETGHKYISAVHSYPVATNENTLQNLFCVSKFVVSNELTDVSKLLALIETSPEVANILAYGVENVHYQLNENNQVVRLDNTYLVDDKYIGNAFLTHTMAGENPQKWEIFKQQNLDSAKGEEQAKSLGFAYYPQTFTDPDNKDVSYEEPNYISIITPIADKFYSKIMSGEAGKVDYEQVMQDVKSSVDEALIKQVEDKFTEEITAKYHREIEARENTQEKIEALRPQAREMAIDNYITRAFENQIKRKVREDLKKEHPDWSAKEISDKAEEICTKDYYRQKVLEEVDEKEIESKVETVITNTINQRITNAKKALETDPEFLAAVQNALTSAECEKEKNDLLSADNYYLYQDKFAEVIKEKLKGLSADLRKEFSDAIKKEYNSFIDSMLKKFDYSDKDKRSTELYNKSLDNLAKVEKTLKAIQRDITSTVRDEMPDAKADDIEVEVEKRMTPEVIRAKLIELKLVTDAQIKEEYNKVLSDYVNNAVGFVKKTNEDNTDDDDDETSGDASDASGDASEATSSEASEESSEAETSGSGDNDGEENPDEEPELPIGENSDYFELFLVTRIKKQYYTFAPLPNGIDG